MYIVMSHFSYLQKRYITYTWPANKPSSLKKNIHIQQGTSCRKQDAWQDGRRMASQVMFVDKPLTQLLTQMRDTSGTCTKKTCNEGTQCEPCFLISGDQAGTGGCCNIQVGFLSVVCIHERKSCQIFPPEYHRPCRFQGIMNGTGVYQS